LESRVLSIDPTNDQKEVSQWRFQLRNLIDGFLTANDPQSVCVAAAMKKVQRNWKDSVVNHLFGFSLHQLSCDEFLAAHT